MQHHPDHERVHFNYVENALINGATQTALSRSETARAQTSPDNRELARQYARVLEAAGRGEDACAVLERLRTKFRDDHLLILDHARSLRSLGKRAAAGAAIDTLLELDPANESAWLERVQSKLVRGQIDTALSSCEDALRVVPNSTALRRMHAQTLIPAGKAQQACTELEALHFEFPDAMDILLAYAGVLATGGRPADASDFYGKALALDPLNTIALLGRINASVSLGMPATDDLDRIGQGLASLADSQFQSVISLADRAQRHDVLGQALAVVAGRPTLDLNVALFLLRKAKCTGDAQLADQVHEALKQRLPDGPRYTYELAAANLLKGPMAAWQEARSMRISRRSPRQAVALANAMIISGQDDLSVRYLRRCARAWPSQHGIRQTLVLAYLYAGHPADALRWVETIAHLCSPTERDLLILPILVRIRALEDAVAIIRRRVLDGAHHPSDTLSLHALISAGLLDEADQLVKKLCNDPGTSLKASYHFQSSLGGALLTELRYFRLSAVGEEAQWPTAQQCYSFFAAASEVLDRWKAKGASLLPSAKPNPDPAQPTVPKRIIQYWSTATKPDEVTDVMASWTGRAGWDYQLFDRGKAVGWLRENLGAEFGKAFGMTRQVVEEADFFRLCYLYKTGGIYVDADDWRKRDIETVFPDDGRAVLFREETGAIVNNLIIAPKNHPVIERALVMACQALLRRDNDNPWTKTGPGLLSRALAIHILEDPDKAAQDTLILDESALRTVVHSHIPLSYKGRSTYWNATEGTTNATMYEALKRLSTQSGLCD